VLDERWTLHWVRGPRTAAALRLPEALGLGDPAALLPMVLNPPPARGGGIGFMPHFESIARGAWQQAARQAGVVLIDPRDPPVKVLAAIRRCDMLLSEALHGVIVADAFRVPWVAVRPLAAMHRAKWADWAATIGLIPRFISLPASTAAEWLAVSPIASLHAGRAWIAGQDRFVHGPGAEWLIDRAARALARAARAAPQLSADAALDRCQSRMAGAIAGLQRSEGSPSHLRTPLESAYQPEQFG
jgi:succinoglycan biosynthesis protein ExoV